MFFEVEGAAECCRNTAAYSAPNLLLDTATTTGSKPISVRHGIARSIRATGSIRRAGNVRLIWTSARHFRITLARPVEEGRVSPGNRRLAIHKLTSQWTTTSPLAIAYRATTEANQPAAKHFTNNREISWAHCLRTGDSPIAPFASSSPNSICLCLSKFPGSPICLCLSNLPGSPLYLFVSNLPSSPSCICF